jgi:prophage regulatory protein
MPERILRLPEVRSCTGLSRSTVYNSIASGTFPRPIALGPRMVGWRESEVAAVNAARIRGASDEEIRPLVASLVAARQGAA